MGTLHAGKDPAVEFRSKRVADRGKEGNNSLREAYRDGAMVTAEINAFLVEFFIVKQQKIEALGHPKRRFTANCCLTILIYML